ncbi:MAG: 4-hydroxy-tetrahydrodipicolinate reductase [Anaerovoracaceae bacterium]|jgi:4-hydroxy-tetrahydrodipicolinate reductase
MKILLAGYGKMGKLIEETVLSREDMEIVGIIDIDNMDSLDTMGKVADIVIDFSHPNMMESIYEYVTKTETPWLCGTTGVDHNWEERLQILSKKIPLIHSSNYSYGVAVFRHILSEIKGTLEGYDIELMETHHNQKIDAPSGTAKLLLTALDPQDEYKKVYGREGMCGARSPGEIGVHVLRGGTVAGEHKVSFFGKDEILEISHKATSRQIFVDGALRTAEKLVKLSPGYYTMEDILF